ncbi:hypothetical protein PF008_g5185 [Phytophthora fragariae]|uniref:Uncharacterized protein n=1 Tax=Phytophthora fragariae TaxID=53985 RepID=A0A6G0S918_9STRA|nr:hypothetical protein PF008_g5185 [Phytophthora fragariae]
MSVMETTVFQTSNAVVKVFYEAAQVGGIEWSDFTFTNVGCSTESSGIESPEDLEREVVSTVEKIAAQKFAFKNWVASTKFATIPTSSGDDRGPLYKEYESVLDGVFPGSVAVSTVLYAVVEAVATLSPPPMNSSTSAYSYHQTASSNFEEFIEYGDLVGCRIARAQLFHEVLQAEGDPCFLATGRRLDDIERVMWRRSDFPGVGNEGRKAMPRTPQLSEPERSVRDTELATFYESPRFSCWMVHLTRQLLQVEDLLGISWRGKLQSRAFNEHLPRAILAQRIASVLQQNTTDVFSSYYPATDSLLMACLPKTAPGLVQAASWVARDHVRHRPAFKDWKIEQLVSKEYLTPRAEAAAAACVPLSVGQLESVATQSWSMYPADHSVVRLCQTSRGLIWLTVYLHGETFGLRSEYRTPNGGIGMEFTDQHLGKSSPALERNIQFIASFQDESTLQITEGTRRLPKKTDQFPTIAATNSFPNGLIVSACSDGSIIQRCCHSKRNIKTKSAYNTSSDANNAGVQYGEESEAFRVIYGRGSVLRALQCGRKEVLLANGVTRVVQDCKKHRHNSRKRPCNDSELPPPPVTTLTVDPETNALVERRPNGVIIVTLTSGARVAYHVDGTRMYSNAGNTHVLVKKRGFADVCIDVDVNVTAQHHAAGERVAVTKGGLRVRSVVDVYDGTHVEISYNTKVTAQVNGRVTTRKPGGQVIVAKDSGRVEYSSQQPGSAPNPNGSDTKDDDDRDVTSHNGVYYFDCRRGRFQLCDSEQNQFHVDFCGTDEEEGPTIAVDLAGVVSDAEAARYEVDTIPAKAVINEPIPPYVFVLNGDGTGLEILRPQDIAEYLEGVASENQVGEIVDTGYSTTRNHVFLCQLRDSKCPKPLLNDAKLHGEMVALQQPVATAAKYLPSYFAEVKDTSPLQQFTTVRRLQQIQPLSADELAEMHAGWAMWEQWQKEREANKECYKVVDPRQPEVIAQEVAMQKKVLAAYKATRARKKMARQKAREMKARNVPQELSPGMRMETVQEGEEALGGEGEDDDESDDEFGQFGSDMSDDDIGETAEVDDPMELLWSAFSQADTEGRGLLSIAQTRLGVVNVLGIGVTANELTEALVRFKIPYPFNVSFDVFTDLVAFFRSGDESNQDSEGHNSEQGDHIPSLKGMVPAQRKGHGTPRGSAAEAIRARNHDSAKERGQSNNGGNCNLRTEGNHRHHSFRICPVAVAATSASMTGPPSPKRQRTDDNKPSEAEQEKLQKVLDSVQKVLDSVQKVDEELEKENVLQAKEVLVIETKYNAKKRPAYVKRNKLLVEIPHFWKQVFVNHPLVGNYLTEDDEVLMDFLETFDITFVGDDGSFKMEMTFKENPYFSPTTLWKQVKFSEDEEEVEVTASELTWKEKAEMTEESEKFPFFQWFVSTDGDQDVAEIIKEEIWKNPVQFYMMDEDEDEEEEEGEEEEGEGEGDEEEAEGEDKE